MTKESEVKEEDEEKKRVEKAEKRKVRRIHAIFAYNVVLSVLALCVLASIWPNTVANQPWPSNETFSVFGLRFALSSEVIIFSIVIAMGALGSLVYTSTALVTYVSQRKLDTAYTLWYLIHPLRGSSLAVVFYVLLRGGLVNLSAGTAALNLYGVAAISGMVGLSSKEAIKKLKETFTTLFEGTPTPPAGHEQVRVQ